VLPALPALDVPPDQFVTLDGVRFHYLDWGGDGEPLLTLAGLGCTAHVYAELAPHLTDRFRVVALTRRGHGLTDQVDSGHSLEDAAEDARRLLDHLGIERAHLVGHSMGCGEISVLAARHPERVASLVYLDGAFDWADSPPRPEDSPDNTSPERYASYDEFVAYVRKLMPGFDAMWGPAFDAMLRTSVVNHPDGSVTERLTDQAAMPFLEVLKEFRHPYDEITAPALAVYALGRERDADDASWREACRDRFAAEMADGQVCELRDATHYLFLDRRDEVLDLMGKFYARV
jgi:pimeloyl-ACP methyl ester carboxylesterase